MKRSRFPFWVCGLGLAAGLCQILLYHFDLDDRGLLGPGSVFYVLLWVLTLAALPLCYFSEKPDTETNPRFFHVGDCTMGAAVALSAYGLNASAQALRIILLLCSAGAVAGLIYRGKQKKRGEPVKAFGSIMLCITLVLRLVTAYQTWSREPQIQNYLFALLGSLALAAFAYCQAAKDAGLPVSPWRNRLGLAAVYLNLAAAFGAVFQPFHFLAAAAVMPLLSEPEGPKC